MATNRSLSQLTLNDPFLSFNWQTAGLPTVGGVVPPIDARIIRCNLSFRQFDAVPVYSSARRAYFPGAADTQPVVLTIDEDDKQTALAWALAWQLAACDERGLYGMPDDFKRTVIFEAFDNKGKVNSRYECKGCWPSGLNPLALDRSQSEKLVLEITLHVDSCFPVRVTA